MTKPLFAIGTFCRLIPLGIMAGIILSGSIYALPEFLRNVDPNKLSATSTGQIMCVYALTAAAIRPMVTMSIGKFGQRKVLLFAVSMLIISMLMLAQLITTGTPEAAYAIPLILYAFCLAPHHRLEAVRWHGFAGTTRPGHAGRSCWARSLGENLARHVRQPKRVVEFRHGQAARVGGHNRTAKLQHHATVEISPL